MGQSTTINTEQLVAHIEAAIRELEALRRQLLTPVVNSSDASFTTQLFGALGRGSWDEYEMDLDWVRFSAV